MFPKLNVENWAQGQNPMIAFFAINHALIAREKCEALRHIKERRIYNHQFPLPDLPSWFAMYRSRKPLLAYKRLISDDSDFTTEQIALFSDLRKFQKTLKHDPNMLKDKIVTPQDIEEGLRYWQDMCSKTLDEIKENITDTSLDPENLDKFRKALIKDELSLGFYFLVYAPCQLFYGMSTAALYHKALNRDISAIENLLKLDPLLLHDSAIGYQIQSVRLYGKINDYDLILDAITKQPRINYKQLADERRSIKSDHGAQIYVLSKASKAPLEVPQIRGLYDALAADYEGTLVDTDIKSPESFDKTIRTKASIWQKQLQQSEKLK